REVATGRPILKLAEYALGNNIHAYSVKYSPDGRMIVIGEGSDSTRAPSSIRLFEGTTGLERNRYHAGQCRLDSLALSPDGRFIATTDEIDNILIWDVFAAAPNGVSGTGELDRCWKELADTDARLAFRAAG